MRGLFIMILTFICSTAWAQRANISVDKMNVLYKGIENPITVLIEDCGCEEIELEGADLEIKFIKKSKSGDCEFIISPKSYGKTRLKVFSKKDGKKKEVYYQDFRLKMIPEPMVYVAGKQKGVIDKSKLLSQKAITVILECSELGKFTVEKIDVIFDFKSQNIITRRTYNSKMLTEDFRNIIREMKTGDEVYFLNVVVKSTSFNRRFSRETKLNSAVRLTIKE